MISKSIFWICGSMFVTDYLSQLLYKILCYPSPFDLFPTTNIPHNARWFFVHAVTNLGICLLGYEDLRYCLTNPSDCAMSTWTRSSRLTFQLAVISHLYHILMFFSSLKKDEWIHHIVMLFGAGPITVMRPSRVTTVGLFFMTGLPGFFDYVLLWLVKLNKLNPMTEKKLYIWISTWLRSPGCALACFLSVPALLVAPRDEKILLLAQALLTIWNGQYYMMKTCVDYGRKLEQPSRTKKSAET